MNELPFTLSNIHHIYLSMDEIIYFISDSTPKEINNAYYLATKAHRFDPLLYYRNEKTLPSVIINKYFPNNQDKIIAGYHVFEIFIRYCIEFNENFTWSTMDINKSIL